MRQSTSKPNSAITKNVALLVVWGMFIGAGLALYDLATITLFIDMFKTSELPGAFISSGILGIVVISVYAHQKNRYSYSIISICSFVLITLSTFIVFYGIENLNKIRFTYIAFVLAAPINVLLFYNFRNMYRLLFAKNQSKRLSEWISIGMILAAAAIFFTVPFIRERLNISITEFIFASGVMLLIASIILTVASSNISILRELTVSAQYINSKNGIRKLSNNQYIKLLTWFSLIFTVVILFVDYYFFVIVEERYPGPEQMADFLGLFYGITLAFGLFFQAFFYNSIMNKYGLKIALLIVPIMIALFTGISIVVGSYFGHELATDSLKVFFIFIGIIKLLSTALKDNLTLPAFRYYFLPIEEALRHDTQIKVMEVVKKFSMVIGGGLLFYFGKLTFDHDLYYGISVIVISVICAIIIFRIYSAYREVLKETLDKQEIVKADRAILTYAEKLAKKVKDVPVQHLPRHLNIINTLDPVVYKAAVLSLVNIEDDEAQKIALLQAGKLCLLEAIPVIEEIMESKYYNVLKNRDLIEKTYDKLRGAEFRLEKLRYIEQLTYSKLVNERIFGASLTWYAEEDIKPKLLNKLFKDLVSKVRYHAAAAAAGSKDESMLKNLISMLDNPIYSNAAVASVTATGTPVLPVLESAFHQTGQLEKIQLRIVQVYGRVGTSEAVELLLKKLDQPNQNVVKGALVALSKSGYNVKKDKALSIRRELENVCMTVVWNMSAFLDLKRNGGSEFLINALKTEINNNYDTIFQLLALLYEPKSVELVKQNINSGNTDQSDFASELLDIFLEEEMKPTLLPILNVSSYGEKINKLQYLIPTTSMSKREVLYNLIQKDYKQINRWTKACAILELSEYNSEEDHDIFAANLVNPHPMLREIAASAYHKLGDQDFITFMNRDMYKKEYAAQAVKLIKELEDAHSGALEESPKLNIEIAKFLNGIGIFEEVPGLVLAELAKMVKPAFYQEGETISHFEAMEDMQFVFIYKGVVNLEKDGVLMDTYKKDHFIHNFDFINEEDGVYRMGAVEDCIVFELNTHDFSELCSFHDVVPEALIKELSIEKKAEPVMTL